MFIRCPDNRLEFLQGCTVYRILCALEGLFRDMSRVILSMFVCLCRVV